MVYIQEAHAIDSPSPMRNGPLVQEPVTLEERLALAQQCTTALSLARIPTLVDLLDDRVGAAYQAWPDRLYLVGADGRIVYAGGPGPAGFRPEELGAAIERILPGTRDEPAPSRAGTPQEGARGSSVSPSKL